MATTTGVHDKLLLQIAKKIPDKKFVQVALELKISWEDAQRYYKSNHVNGEFSTYGALLMLHTWKEDTKEEDQQTELKRALEKAQLKGVADEIFGRKILTNGHDEDERQSEDSRPTILLGLREHIIVEEHLKHDYRDPVIFLDGIAEERSFQPRLHRRDGSSLENSRYDIFDPSCGGNIRKRILVSGNQPHRKTALSHILAYDWATENQLSPISDKEFVFKLEADKFTRGQSIQKAIKDQLFSGLDKVDEHVIQQILEGVPHGVTILIDGVHWKEIGKYGEHIRKVLTGQALPEVTVMVTTTPHSAKKLHQNTPGGYDRIFMENVY